MKGEKMENKIENIKEVIVNAMAGAGMSVLDDGAGYAIVKKNGDNYKVSITHFDEWDD